MRLVLSLFACTVLLACAARPPMTAMTETTEFVIVRHAEKLGGTGPDPALSGAGHARAAALARVLADAPLVAVYSTAYARTRQTATPAADAHGLPVTTYDPREPADALARRLLAAHGDGTVLVVGHSNTVPAIASALCGCDVAAMEETEYDRRVVVTVDAAGATTLAIDRLPVPAGG